jgi:hypothetical protein
MRRGLRSAIGTTLAVGLLVTAPVAVARHGADDPPGDDNVARGGGGGVEIGDDRGVGGGAGVGSGEAARGGGNDRDVRVAGSCTLRSTAKLKLSPEDGGVEAEFEVDENRVGKRWNVVMNRNGARVLSRKATTRAPSGSFEVRAVLSPGRPRTTVTAVARRAATGEVCRATATL